MDSRLRGNGSEGAGMIVGVGVAEVDSPFDRLRACPVLDTGTNGRKQKRVGFILAAESFIAYH
jgi:hypothetical protein